MEMPVADFVPLARSFYEPSAAVVAPRLLGHVLIRNVPEGLMVALIVETEAYVINDPACHGFPGETPRNRSMYGAPGHAYVYFIYGNYWCVNAVCRPKGCAEAVLVRAVEPASGIELMRARRSGKSDVELTNGPGKLCTALAINKALDGADLCDRKSQLWIARHPAHKKFLLSHGPMITTTRVGVTKAAELPLRFYLKGSAWISKRSKIHEH
jgi:DNA-3-methyladenine glycosylase